MPRDTAAEPTIVLVGHGMVGQRFLEALAERGLTAAHRVVVLCEEPRPAYDRVAAHLVLLRADRPRTSP